MCESVPVVAQVYGRPGVQDEAFLELVCGAYPLEMSSAENYCKC